MRTAARSCRSVGAATLAIAWLSAGSLGAQMNGHDVHAHVAAGPITVAERAAIDSFVAAARGGTARYRDRDLAIADGFRRLGPDFPGMGEHWVRPSLVFGGRFEAAAPQVLTYAVISGRPVLAGVAYVLALDSTQSPPAPPPGSHWHDHSGSVDGESVLLSQVASGSDGGSVPRVAMLHAWVWLENADGLFASDNSRLPYLRLGLMPPATAPPDATSALALASGGGPYFVALARAVGRTDASEDVVILSSISSAANAVRERLRMSGPTRELAAADLAALGAIWRGTWAPVHEHVRPAVAARLALAGL